MKRSLAPLAFAAAFFAVSLSAPAVAARVVVRVGPPAARVEVRGVSPSPRHVWHDGYWRWNGHAHVWVGGTWVMPPHPGSAWVPGHWKRTPGGWSWIEGHWRRQG